MDIVIVGGGAAGLSAAGALKRRGRDPIVLDKLARVGDVWARRYDRLRLHTIYSSLAHYPLPRLPPFGLELVAMIRSAGGCGFSSGCRLPPASVMRI